MQKINFQNLPSTTTPVNATNLNQLQTNVENEFNVGSWTNLTLLNNFIAYTGQNTPQYRRIGKCVYLRGVIKTSVDVTTSTRTIATLPFTTTQYTNTYYPCVMVTSSTRVADQIQFTKTGDLLAPRTMTTTDWIPLDGIVIVLD